MTGGLEELAMRSAPTIVFFVIMAVGVSAAAQTATTPLLLSDEQIAALPGSDKLATATSSIAEMQDVLAAGLRLLDKTRNDEKDVLKLNCINEKLSAIKGFLKIAEKARMSLEDAVSRGDSAEQTHQMKLVLLASTRVRSLGEELEACAGEVVQYSGPTKLNLDLDENVRTDNPTEIDTSDVTIDPLPDVSPFQ